MLHRISTPIDSRRVVVVGLALVLAIALMALQFPGWRSGANSRTGVQSRGSLSVIERSPAFLDLNVGLMPQGLHPQASPNPAAIAAGVSVGFWEANTLELPQSVRQLTGSTSVYEEMLNNPRFREANFAQTR